MYVHMHARMYACISVYIPMCMYVYMHIIVYVHIYIHTCTYMCIYRYMCEHVYNVLTFMPAWTHTQANRHADIHTYTPT